MLASLHNTASTFSDHANPFTPYNVHSHSSSSIFGRNAPPTLTTESMISLRQQMDESNHEMINMLTQQLVRCLIIWFRDNNMCLNPNMSNQ